MDPDGEEIDASQILRGSSLEEDSEVRVKAATRHCFKPRTRSCWECYPWKFEIRPRANPPDINYRDIIENDGYDVEHLLEDESRHFTKRCLRYQVYDKNLEAALLGEYASWVEQMRKHTSTKDEENRAKFF